MKDQNKQLLEETNKCYKMILNHCINLEDCLEDLTKALSDKNPKYKYNILNFLEKLIENIKFKNGFKSISP